MDRVRRRRVALGLVALCGVAACGAVPAYVDTGPANLTVELVGQESSFWARREVWIGVYAGPVGAETYRGSRQVTGATRLGVPVGQSVNLVLAFEEAKTLGSSSTSQSVVHELGVVTVDAAWRVEVSDVAMGFSHDVVRVR